MHGDHVRQQDPGAGVASLVVEKSNECANLPTPGSALLGLAVAFGVAIAAVDNFALEGEVSPIVVVGMLFAATAIVGVLSPQRAWLAALAVWVWLPLAHLVKHVLGIRDTLRPNTYASIAALGVFAVIVALIGMACGIVAKRLIARYRSVSPMGA